MIIYGASGHGKVLIEIMHANGLEPSVIWDDSPKGNLWQYQISMPIYDPLPEDREMIIAIGNNRIRKQIAGKNSPFFKFLKLIHPEAYISPFSEVGAGTVVMSGSVINPDSSVGRHCIINTKAIVEHDCVIGDMVHISPDATLCGNTTIGDGTHIGAGAVIIPGIKIGSWCTIGAGATIIRDVPDHSIVVGNPGRIIGRVEPVLLHRLK